MSTRLARATLLGALVVGCLQVSTVAAAPPDKEARARAERLFPLAPGTSWTWRRSVKRGDRAVAQTEETRTIVKVERVDAYFKVVFNGGGPLFVNADGVFGQQCDRGGKCSYAALYPRATKGQTSFRTTYGGDVIITVTVKPRTKPVTTPAGTFTGCVEYAFPIGTGGRQVVYCPGVGVALETSGDTVYAADKSEKTTERLELLRFKRGS